VSVALACRELGHGPPLLCLHGLLGSGTNWRSIGRRLAERGRRVLLVDLRNHGRSPHAPGMRYAELAGDVLALLEREGIERAALLGHSMGGKCAMHLALAAPERVERLVVADIAPRPSGHEHAALLAALRALPAAALASRRAADAALAAHLPDPALRQFLLQNLVPGSEPRWRVDLAAIAAALPDLAGFDPPPAGARYPGPALFVRGERSDYLSEADLPLIEGWFPRARLVTVAGAGHWLHAERPDAFLAVIAPFLR